MKKTFLERYSFVILICLVFTSVLQVGILWNYHNHGIPIRFLKLVMGYESQGEFRRRDFFSPYKINILNGYDEPSVALTPSYENFEKHWKVLSDNLKKLINDKDLVLVEEYSDELWSRHLRKPGVLVKFHNEFKVDLLKYFLDIDKDLQVEFERFEKILFSLDSRRKNIDVYIMNSKNIYNYKLAVGETFEKIYFNDNLLKDFDDSRFFGFNLLHEIFPESQMVPFNFRPDVDVYIRGERFLSIFNVQITLPEWLGEKRQELKYINKAANDILGEDRYSYHADIDEMGNVVLGNINHIYRISSDGFLEYKYLGDNINNDEIIVGEAFERAVDFIVTKNSLNNLNHIFLSDVYYDKKTNLYTFLFDYELDDLRLFFKSPDNKGFDNFIKITTDGNNVLKANMVVRKISIDNKVLYFDSSFRSFSSNLFRGFDINSLQDIKIKEIFVGYVNDLKLESKLRPYWFIKEGQNSFLKLSMEQGGAMYGLE